jgi:hypothetical protein
MTEFEYINAIIILGEDASTHSMNFIYVLFAYSLVAYFAAPKLSRLQVWLISLVYTSFVFAPITANLRAVQNAIGLSSEFTTLFPESAMEYTAAAPRATVLLIVHLLAWSLSILFMFQWRRQHKH